MQKQTDPLTISDQDIIKNKIYTIRGMQVMLDRDLAELYEVKTKVLNQAVKRNIERFPPNFMFQLTINEKYELVTNCDQFDNLKHSSNNPFVFTEQGVSMLAGILKSKVAIKISIQIIDAFVAMRKFITVNSQIFQRLDHIEQKQLEHKIDSDKKFDKLFTAMEANELTPKQGIFFDGQIFDAYKFVSDLIRSSKNSIILIDNYIDDSVLAMLAKRNKNVSALILTKNIPKQLQLDLKKHNAQYPAIEIQKFEYSHDRFIILDAKDVYHFGASLKDLGKKWFAFSKMDTKIFGIKKKLPKIIA